MEPLLDPVFFVRYGDSYLWVDYQDVMSYFLQRTALGLMVVHRNEDRWDRSNVVVADGFVRAYDKVRRLPGMVYIDYGVSVLRRDVLSRIPEGVSRDLSEIFQELIREDQLLAYEASARFHEVGSWEGLREFEALVRAEEVCVPSPGSRATVSPRGGVS